ncbi:MAG: hypothetical protein DMF60_14030 [Acidobacteria bacterium]|nr:MAG: hypothetical protein DMF60_14030 [Acidobacteriota bacterium]
MRQHLAIQICVLILVKSTLCLAGGHFTQSDDYGPEVRSFLDLMRHEEDELEFQIKHNEISRREYLRSKTQIVIHRQTVLDLVRASGKDYVPELHVVAASELDQLIEDGTRAIKGVKRGDIIRDKWRYLGSVHKAETFYIFERLTRK